VFLYVSMVIVVIDYPKNIISFFFWFYTVKVLEIIQQCLYLHPVHWDVPLFKKYMRNLHVGLLIFCLNVSRQIKQKYICIPLLHNKCIDYRINLCMYWYSQVFKYLESKILIFVSPMIKFLKDLTSKRIIHLSLVMTIRYV
jgi:hypothetical protein